MLKLSAEAAKQYTPEQQEYIEKYAVGLLIGWTAEHIGNFISSDVGDGFHDHMQESLFPDWEKEEEEGKEPLVFQAYGEVTSLLDDWLAQMAEQLGLKPQPTEHDDKGYWMAAVNAVAAGQGGKYPVWAAD